jgi:hypothetical protein
MLAAFLFAGCGDPAGSEAPPAVPRGGVTDGRVPTGSATADADRGKLPDTKAANRVIADSPKTPLELDRPAFYPVLRTISQADPLTKTAVHMKVADGLGAFIFRKRANTRSSGPLDFVLKSELPRYALSESQVIGLSYENFAKDHVSPRFNKQAGELVVQIESDGGFSASLLGAPGTYDNLTKAMRAPELALYVGGPNLLIATPKGTRFESVLLDMAQKERAKASSPDLTPMVYYWGKDKSPVPVTSK